MSSITTRAMLLTMSCLFVALVVGCQPTMEEPEMPGAPVTYMTLSDASFAKHVTGSDKIVVVDFWAEWCGPCRRMEPVLDSLARRYQPQGVVFAKVNVDDCPDVSQELGVATIPNFMIYNHGERIEQFVGVTPERNFRQSIDKALAAAAAE